MQLQKYENNQLEMVGRVYKPKSENLKNIRINNYLKVLRRSVDFLGVEYEMKPADVARAAIWIGIESLWTFRSEIDQIKNCRQAVHKSGNTTYIGWYEKGSFDLGSSETESYSARIEKAVIDRCHKIAKSIGLGKGVTYQLAIAAGLIRASELTQIENKFMFNLLDRFVEWLKTRSRQAVEIRKTALKQPMKTKAIPRKTWDDILSKNRPELEEW